MGSFSWNRADKVKIGEAENIYHGSKFKMLIPKEFGGGFIIDHYRDYGDIVDDKGNEYDMFELLAFWNHEQVVPRSTVNDVIYKKFEVGEDVTVKGFEYQDVLDEVRALAGKTFKIAQVCRSAESGKQLFVVDGLDLAFPKNFFEQETQYIPRPAQGLLYEGSVMPLLPTKSKFTCHNRVLGIYLCSEEVDAVRAKAREEGKIVHVDRGSFLKYPLKLVSPDFKGIYEDCKGFSESDPDQGARRIRRR